MGDVQSVGTRGTEYGQPIFLINHPGSPAGSRRLLADVQQLECQPGSPPPLHCADSSSISTLTLYYNVQTCTSRFLSPDTSCQALCFDFAPLDLFNDDCHSSERSSSQFSLQFPHAVPRSASDELHSKVSESRLWYIC